MNSLWKPVILRTAVHHQGWEVEGHPGKHPSFDGMLCTQSHMLALSWSSHPGPGAVTAI